MTFLKKVYSQDRKIFIILIVFILLSALTTILRREIPPFFTWYMYSYPQSVTSTNSFYTLEYDSKTYNYPEIWDHHKRLFFVYTNAYYFECLSNNGYDDTQLKLISLLNKIDKNKSLGLNFIYEKKDTNGYGLWLKRYTENLAQQKIDSINLYKVTVNYVDGKQNVLEKKLVLSNKSYE